MSRFCLYVRVGQLETHQTRRPSRPSPNRATTEVKSNCDDTLPGTDEELIDSSGSDDDEDVPPLVPDDEWEWHTGDNLANPLPPHIAPAVRLTPSGVCSAVKAFMSYITTPLVANVCKYTNITGVQQTVDYNIRYPQRKRTWPKVDALEMFGFLGVCIAMSVCPKGDERSYFSKVSMAGYVPPNLARFMTYNRFIEIKGALTFNDKTLDVPYTDEGHDKLFKLRPILDALNKQFKLHMSVSGELSIDEMMIAAYHRTYIRQYMPNKPDKYGIKCWAICDSRTGYLYHIEVYAGKRPGEQGEKGLGHRVVEGLVDACDVPQNAIIAMDRFFSSPTLAKCLLEKGFFVVGSCMHTRKGWPSKIGFAADEYNSAAKKRDLRGQVRWAVTQDKKMQALCWFDSKPVFMLSTCFKPDGCVVVRKHVEPGGKKTKIRINFPQCIDQYNKLMGGVDLNDGQRKVRNLMSAVGTKKWTVRLFMGLISMAVFNACISYNKVHAHLKSMPIAQFTIQLQYGLLKKMKPEFLEVSWKSFVPPSQSPGSSPPSSPTATSRSINRGSESRLSISAPVSPVVSSPLSALTQGVADVATVAILTPGITQHQCLKTDGKKPVFTKRKRKVNGLVTEYWVKTWNSKLQDCVVCCSRKKNRFGKTERQGSRTSFFCQQCNVAICSPVRNRACWDSYHT